MEGEVAGSVRPLEGLRVLELGQIAAAPVCAMLLADMGAEVIKVEPPDRGDGLRYMGTVFVGGESPDFLSLNRNKKSIAVDLRQPEGREIILRLARDSDVWIENYRPGVMARLGLDYEAVRLVNPRLVYCSISGFGPEGPYQNKPAVDPILQAMGGLMSITGEPEGRPVLVGAPIIDLTCGALAAYGVLSALTAREHTGQGQKLELALLDSGLYLLLLRAVTYLNTGEVPRPEGSAHRQRAPYQAFRTQDGYIYICVRAEEQWPQLCRVLGCEHLAQEERFATGALRVRHRQELEYLLEAILQQRPTAEWQRRLEEADILCGPVQNFAQVFSDPQVRQNQMVVRLEHPKAGPIRLLGLPVKLKGTPGRIESPPPTLGQHTAEILARWGYRPDEIAALHRRGAIALPQEAPK